MCDNRGKGSDCLSFVGVIDFSAKKLEKQLFVRIKNGVNTYDYLITPQKWFLIIEQVFSCFSTK